MTSTPGDGTTSPPRALSRAVVLAAAALLVVCTTVLALSITTEDAFTWSNAAQLGASALFLVLVVPIAATSRSVPARLLTVGALLWLIGDLVVLSLSTLGMLETHHLVPELAYLAGQTAWMFCGLAVLGPLARATSLRRLLDGALVAALVLFALFSFTQAQASTHLSWYGTTTLVVDSIYLALTAIAAAGVSGWQRGPFWAMTAGAAVLLATDLAFAYAVLNQGPWSIWVLDTGWTVSTLLRCLSIALVARHLLAGRRMETPTTRRPRLLAPLVLAGAALVVAFEPIEVWSWFSRVLALTLLGLTVLREVLVSFELRNLTVAQAMSQEALRHRAEHDDLTGLLRRDRIFERLADTLATSHENGSTTAVAHVDLDDFNAVNDSFGHQVGDQVLARVAQRLERIAPGRVGRVGGDEFIIVWGPILDETASDDLHARITDAITAPIDLGGGAAVRILGSVAVVEASAQEAISAGALIARAERAGRVARPRGDRSAPMTPHTSPTMALADLAGPLRALRNGDLVVWYQPIMDLRTGTVVGAEALLRMRQPDGTMRPATQFLPALHSAGYSHEVTQTVLAQVLPAFARPEVAERGWFCSVNLSAQDVSDRTTLDLVSSGLRSSGLSPDRLVIEVDERVDPDGPVRQAITRLRSFGVGIALDDFGAGSSTFGQIAGLAPSILKLDIGLLPDSNDANGQGSGMRSSELLDAFTRLAHHLGIAVVVEGIEQLEQLALLQGLDVDLGQGFLWSAAVPLEDLLAATPAPLRAAQARAFAAH